MQASRGFEPRSLDSESRVLTVTPRGQVRAGARRLIINPFDRLACLCSWVTCLAWCGWARLIQGAHVSWPTHAPQSMSQWRIAATALSGCRAERAVVSLPPCSGPGSSLSTRT